MVEIDAAAVHAYREAGWIALGRILDDDEIAALRREEERFRLDVGFGTEANQTLRVNIQLCDRSAAVRRFCTAGSQLAAVSRLLGPDICLTHQQFVTKLPDGATQRSDIPLHQDAGYGRLEPPTDVTVWLPLVDTDERNGCLQVVPGSHRLGLLDHDGAEINPALREARGPGHVSPVPVPLAAGHAVAFSGLTLHGSGPNRSSLPRPALYVRYCEPHAKMLSEGGRPVLDDPHSWMVAGEA